jgi:hypothetical protein
MAAGIAYALDTLNMDRVRDDDKRQQCLPRLPKFGSMVSELNRRGSIRRSRRRTLLNRLNPSVIEFVFDTTRMTANMVATGAKRRFSAKRYGER